MNKEKVILRINKKSIIAWIYALAPFLSYYNFPLINKNLFIILILLISIKNIPKIFSIKCGKDSMSKIHRLVYGMCLYIMLSEIIRLGMTITSLSLERVYYFILFFGTTILSTIILSDIEISKFCVNHIQIITIFMTICVFIQSIMRYLLSINANVTWSIYLPLPSLMDEERAIDIFGRISEALLPLFRPRAFFIEPAGYSIYCTLGLIVSIYKKNLRQAIFISIGILLTTSGIGIAATVLVWTVWIIVNLRTGNRKAFVTIICALVIGVPTAIYTYIKMPVVANVVNRMFFHYNGYNSFKGRLGTWSFVQELKGFRAIIGMGFRHYPTFLKNGIEVNQYMTGITELFYCQGIIGGLIMAWFYFKISIDAWRRKNDALLNTIAVSMVFVIGVNFFKADNVTLYIPLLLILSNNTDIEAEKSYDCGISTIKYETTQVCKK